MKKFILIIVAVIVKILATITIGLVFTSDIVSYVSMVSRTNSLTIRFLMYILAIDIITLVIFTHIATTFFKVSRTVKNYLLYTIVSLVVFWLSDVFFLVEIKSGQLLHHIFTLIVLLSKYILILFLSTYFVLQIHKIDTGQKLQLFLNYQAFWFKQIINRKIFSFSRVLYNNNILFIISITLILFINFLSFFLYTNSVLFYFNIFICSLVLSYLMLISFHQIKIVLAVYNNYLTNSDISQK